MTRIKGTFHKGQYTFLITSRSFLLRIRNVSHVGRTENQNTHFMFNNSCFLNRALYEVMWEKNTAEPRRPQTTIWRMRIICWIPKATNTHLEHVILITFPCNNGYTTSPQCYDKTYIVLLQLTRSAYCAVRAKSLNIIRISFGL